MGSTLIYVKGGYANAIMESPFGNEKGDGFRVGAGVERKLSGNFYGKLEYRYSDYEADVTRQQVALGVGIRF